MPKLTELILCLCLCLCLVLPGQGGCKSGCKESKGTMTRKDPATNVIRGVEQLRKQVNLPDVPIEAEFELMTVGTPGGMGPTDHMLVAVLRFDKPALQHLISVSAQRPNATPRILTATRRDWFPAALKAALSPAEEDTLTVRGRKFDAESFLKNPYASGYFIVVDGDEYVILTVETS